MPNYCSVDLTVSGDEGPLAEFEEAAESADSRLDFSQHAPLPNPTQDAARKTWGTKWTVEEDDLTIDGDASLGFMHYVFVTANDPPAAWLAVAAATHPELDFLMTYGEPGNQIAGCHSYSGGAAADITDLRHDEAMQFMREDENLVAFFPEDEELV